MKTRLEKIKELDKEIDRTIKDVAVGFNHWLRENYDYVPNDAWSPKTGEKIAYLTWDVYEIYLNTKLNIS